MQASAAADRFATIEKRRLVLLARADHHDPFDREALELPVHGFRGGLIGGGLIAATPP